ncbi:MULTISPECIES: hypothetical protein [Clostridium]|uniref:hypothetical protein n=1 Tax=Clostridium TaxID=1485 RepID=UPI00129BE110|nr:MULTISPECIES: hypothetical protein [Clostridium]MDU1068726.1 hypothetical protein [Clostridium sp.]MDU1336969.1 hypothetical protein [Clostridium butyricum]MDU2676310.1 hypothetical protein [Clostridium sp.]MDU4210653.1 hypothetical protein [Clostridium sp.]MDU5173915.1 hypothetical protein [Clostridium sp.]
MNSIINYFKNKGNINPLRSVELIKRAIKFNDLNLNKLTIFTEAASGEFIYTPIIAAMAGAHKVYAIAADSQYATIEEIEKDTYLFAKLCGVEGIIEVVVNKEKINEADIVTNLGFVRPIDKNTIDNMKKNAVIPYMCEAWEVREGDVDIAYCKEKSIKVMGTNENYHGLDVFDFSGPLVVKMLFECGLEIFKSKIVILSGDKFGKVIYNTLSSMSTDVFLVNEINNQNIKFLKDADALIVADYTSKECFIGKNSRLTGEKLKELSQFITVIQFAGLVDVEDLQKNEIGLYPEYTVGSYRMGRTLAYLGPKPIIDLHCAGLKVGELMYNNKVNKKHSKNVIYQYIDL